MSASSLAPEWLAHPDDANALARGIWPASARRDAAGVIEIAGVSALALAREFGTPLYVVDEAEFRERAVSVRGAFEAAAASIGTRAEVYYAGKAFLCTTVARWVADEGLSLDVASGGELAVAVAAGIDPALLGFHGNNKSHAEIDRAVDLGVGAIVLDSVVEIGRVADAAQRRGVVQAVRLRINAGVHASTHEYLATAREDQKFGIPIAEAPAAVAEIRSRASLRFRGLHSHIGSQIFDSAGFVEAANRLVDLHADLLAGGEVPELNLGGGFGIAYTTADRVTPIAVLARQIADAVATRCSVRGIPVPVIAVEPGRLIAGPSGVTLYQVGTIKDVAVGETGEVRRYVSVDGGMSDNLRPALYGADYSVRLAGRSSAADPALVRIAGKHCESGDIVVRDDYLPGDVAPDDVVAVPATGAYCWSLASNYNYLGRPPVVAVHDGAARIIVRGETEADVLRRDPGVSEADE